ncbi:hypothetical protein [Herbaspirillum chlorophenolicum]|uniref:hypothetical protein n=1 Tax=Herbaspirillum chlorophenolicum TaxID=211589 RepID=UPI0012E15ED1|nr:hypothetical protein [Herbaspirillum chlorophenolicum]
MILKIKLALTLATVILGALSAWYWYRSSVARIAAADPDPDNVPFYGNQIITNDGTDFFPTVELQSTLNKQAAVWAALAALSQVLIALVDLYLQFSG